MDINFVRSSFGRELQPLDCLIEVPIEGESGDHFELRGRGIVSLGHHPGTPVAGDAFALTTVAWQAYILASACPSWRTDRIIRPLSPINLDGVLAALLAHNRTRVATFKLACLQRLLSEISLTDVLGPLGYEALEWQGRNASLVNAINNRAGNPTVRNFVEARDRHETLAHLILSADKLQPEPRRTSNPPVHIFRDDGVTAMAVCHEIGGLRSLYHVGYACGIVVTPKNAKGLRRCTIGRAAPAVTDIHGRLLPPPSISWEALNALEPGWGGKATFGGSPREGTRLTDDEIWERARVI